MQIIFNGKFGDYPEIHIAADKTGAGAEIAAFVGLTGLTAMVVGFAINILISVVVNKVMASFADVPDTTKQEVDQRASAIFNGAVNTISQGHAIPIVYGRFRVGSTTISANVSAERNTVAMDDSVRIVAGQTATGNVLSNDQAASTLAVNAWSINSVDKGPGETYTTTGYTVTLGADGAYTITTDESFSGTIRFEYSATDSKTPATTAILTATVSAMSIWDNGGGY